MPSFKRQIERKVSAQAAIGQIKNFIDLSKSAINDEGVNYQVLDFIVHSDYTNLKKETDIALLRVKPMPGFEESAQSISPISVDETNAMLANVRGPANQVKSSNINMKDHASAVQKVDHRSAINHKLFLVGFGRDERRKQVQNSKIQSEENCERSALPRT